MQSRYKKLLAAMRQLLGFVDQHPDELVAVNTDGGRAALNEAVEQLAERGGAQASHQLGRRGKVLAEYRLARALRRKHIAPLVKVARVKVPEIAELAAVELPPINANGTETAEAALLLAGAVEPHVGRLQAVGLSPTFLADLRAAAAHLLGSVASKGEHRRKAVGATENIDKQVENARRVVGAVDALVRAELDADDPLVAEWNAIMLTVRRALRAANRPDAEGGTGAAPEGAASPGVVQPAPSSSTTALVATPKVA